MDVKDLFGYEDETAVVTGAASGIGKATAELLVEFGAEVYGLDVKEVKVPGVKHVPMDLNKKESIELALRRLPSKVDKVFAVAGVAGVFYTGRTFDPVDVVTINFVGHRHLIENLIPRMSEGCAIAIIASIGGMGWVTNLQNVSALLNIPGFDEARAWLEAHRDDPKVIGGPREAQRPYCFSKECLIAYAKMRSWQLAEKGIRINTVSPGITETPMLPDFAKIVGTTVEQMGKSVLSPIGRYAKPIEQAWPLIFLNSKLASYISGADLPVDFGFTGGAYTGQIRFPVSLG
jgi:NAD(P)-dependent dehydrogenase (short-subunit alcohol dehydrogenase family)